MDSYAEFIEKYRAMIDLYSNVDVIPNPELSLRNLRYLEKKGLTPIPVVHYGTDTSWLQRYIDEGYPLIALGGLVGSTMQDGCRRWLDDCFNMVCDQPSRLPRVKIHGFGVTSHGLLLRYPWWSVDSTSWTKKGAYGLIAVPHKRGGNFVFTEQHYTISVSVETSSRDKNKPPKAKRKSLDLFEGFREEREAPILSFRDLKQGEKQVILDWLEYIQIPFGSLDKHGEVKEMGVSTSHTHRRAANLLFYEEMTKHVPQYPWPFRTIARKMIPGLLDGGAK